MPEHAVLKETATWLQDLALFCTVAKPSLLTIVEFVIFFMGLKALLRFAFRAH